MRSNGKLADIICLINDCLHDQKCLLKHSINSEVWVIFLIVLQGPGVQLINGISGIFGNIGSVILGIPPNQPATTSTPPPPPAGCPVEGTLKVAHHHHQHHHHPVEGCPAEGEEEGVCTATCNEWPYSQCRVELRRPDGSWQAKTKIQKYTIIHNQKWLLAGSDVPQSLYGQTRSFQSFPPEVHKLPRVSLMFL